MLRWILEDRRLLKGRSGCEADSWMVLSEELTLLVKLGCYVMAVFIMPLYYDNQQLKPYSPYCAIFFENGNSKLGRLKS